MLVSLVHAGKEHASAGDIFAQNRLESIDDTLRERLKWVRAIADFGAHEIPVTPFTKEQLPEVIGALMAMSDINRFSHVVMAASPVSAPFGLQPLKSAFLRVFGIELRVTKAKPLVPGKALGLLPPAPVPEDMAWAKPNPRIADAVSRWAAAVEQEAESVVSPDVRQVVRCSLKNWHGELMPISRSWADKEVASLEENDRSIAQLALVLAKAPYQVDEGLIEAVLRESEDQIRFIRILAWASSSAARRFAEYIAELTTTRLENVGDAA